MRSEFSFINLRPEWAVFLITVGVSLTLLFVGKNPAVSAVKQEIGGLTAQIARPLSVVRRSLDLWRENAELRIETIELRLENAELRGAYLENSRLRAMLGLRERFTLQLHSAEVIGYPGAQIGGRLILDVGRRNGVVMNAAVLSTRGLVGKVVEVSEFTALVQTLEGNAFGVSVFIERSRATGILRWIAPGEWTIVGLASGDDVRVGDLVLTTGLGYVFPKNLRIGVVAAVEPEREATRGWCRIQPFVDFDSVEEVFVVIPDDRHSAQETAADGEARP